jgi:hypothetical protein
MKDPEDQDIAPSDCINDHIVTRRPVAAARPEFLIPRPPYLWEPREGQEPLGDFIDQTVRHVETAALGRNAIPDIIEILIRLG